MLARMRSAMANLVGGVVPGSSGSEPGGGLDLPVRFTYGRPEFLGLSQDEVECSADHIARPILILNKETKRLPWTTGYAEVINAGKSTHNEDQASCEVLTVKKKIGTTNATPNRNSSSKRRSSLPNGEGLQLKENSESDSISFHYWSLFDGHAGSGAAVVASKLLQHHIVEQLQEIVDILKNSAVPPPTCLGEEPESMNANSKTLTRAASLRGSVGAPGSPGTPPTRFFTEKKILQECLVMGAIETAFKEMKCSPKRSRNLHHASLLPADTHYCTALQPFDEQTAFCYSQIFQILTHQFRAPAAIVLHPSSYVFVHTLVALPCYHVGGMAFWLQLFHEDHFCQTSLDSRWVTWVPLASASSELMALLDIFRFRRVISLMYLSSAALSFLGQPLGLRSSMLPVSLCFFKRA